MVKKYMESLDKKIRSMDKRINQVSLSLLEKDTKVSISNYKKNYVKENRINTRFFINVSFKDGDKTSSSSYNWGASLGLEILEKDIE